MTTSRATILLGAAIGLAGLAAPSAGAIAADLNYGGSVKDTYAPPPPPGRTWYIKGFLGMHNYDSDDLDSEIIAGNFTLHHQDYKSAPFFGLGLGVMCNRWLRLEGTAEYRGSSVFFAQDSYTGNGFPPGTNEYTADIESWVGLANAYIDVFTWRGITPYVGAGIGIASISVDGLKDVNVPNNSVFYGADNTETNFAWALHAGLAYDVTSTVTLDIGYRYLNLGDAKSGKVRAYDGSSEYASVDLDDVDSHDLMLGMRWKLDHPAPVYQAMK
ncbi:MAG: outer membrane protein [Hyphomicrobium sp.]